MLCRKHVAASLRAAPALMQGRSVLRSLATLRLNKCVPELSRRGADAAISKGRVSVNSETIVNPGHRCSVGDVVRYQGRIQDWKHLVSAGSAADDDPSKNGHFVYIKYWKPRGVACTAYSNDPHNIISVAKFNESGLPRVFTVGRLDKASTGLILLTNDGRVNQALLGARGRQWLPIASSNKHDVHEVAAGEETVDNVEVSNAELTDDQEWHKAVEQDGFWVPNTPASAQTIDNVKEGRTLVRTGHVEYDDLAAQSTLNLARVPHCSTNFNTNASASAKKVYYIEVGPRPLTDSEIDRLRRGVDITTRSTARRSVENEEERENGVALVMAKTLPALIERTRGTNGATSGILMTLYEGRNRQIRRMIEEGLAGTNSTASKLYVSKLHRVSFAGVTLGGISEGQWKHLDEEEMSMLRDAMQRA